MKKTSLFILGLILSVMTFAQVPSKMSFQTVVRNNLGKLVVNKSIGVRLSILKTSSNGVEVYVETHAKASNTNGLVMLEVGTGTVTTGTFDSIDWAQGPYFLKTEMDVNGGANYTISGVTEFVSVPYALNSKNADNANSVKTLSNGANVGDMCYWNGTKWIPLAKGAQGQTLTFCDGKPTWAVGGVCPGTITALNCSSATHEGILLASNAASGVTSVISYTGGNTGPFSSQVVSSTGVTGLTATLQAGNFANGTGSLMYAISGTPSSVGTASFTVSIGGKVCTLSRTVSLSAYAPNVFDIEGNSYKTIYIGNQQWMGENLKTAKYNDGTLIPNVKDNTQWSNLTTGAWAYYNNYAANNVKYGKLYNWYAVSPITNGNKNICPVGWHVPTDAEWTALTDYLGGSGVAGGKMKEVSTTNWKSPNTDATNMSLFTGLPGGFRTTSGYDRYIYCEGYWWSSSEATSYYVWYRNLNSVHGSAVRTNYEKANGYSVRCLRD